MTGRSWLTIGLIIVAAVFAVSVISQPVCAGKLEDAIAKTPVGAGKGMIDPKAEPGFMGIPGAPQFFWLWGVLWGVWVGWIFSSVGAFGGIMAGVGHITVFGLANYGKSFKDTNPTLSKLLTDSIRVCNQYLVGLSALISSTTYYRMGRLVLALALFLGIGSVLGAFTAAKLSAGKVQVSSYLMLFGLIVFAVAGVLFYETTPWGQASRKAAKAAAKAFEDANIGGGKNSGHAGDQGVKTTSIAATRIAFTFYGVEFSFNPIWPFIGGFVISAISALIGVGGGFLYVPFLTSIAGLPMFIVAGTSALAVLVSMITSIFTYMFLQSVPIDWILVGTELIGIFIGSILGPMTSKYIPEIWLKRLFVVLALYVGIGYTTKGYFGASWLPGL